MMTATSLPQDCGAQLPVWVRAPARGQEYFTGFSRSKLYQLATDGLIESASIREGKQKKGTRLFRLDSVLAYIEKHAK